MWRTVNVHSQFSKRWNGRNPNPTMKTLNFDAVFGIRFDAVTSIFLDTKKD
jgi:hypothetical protein